MIKIQSKSALFEIIATIKSSMPFLSAKSTTIGPHHSAHLVSCLPIIFPAPFSGTAGTITCATHVGVDPIQISICSCITSRILQ